MLRSYMFLPNLIKICVLYKKLRNLKVFEKLKIHVIFDCVDKLEIYSLNLLSRSISR